MRTVKPIHTVALLTVLAGCSPSSRTVTTTHTGDLGQFILQSVTSHGGYVKTTNALPDLQSRWQAEVLTGTAYLEGREQVSILIPGEQFGQVTSYLAQAFGAPSQPATIKSNDMLHGCYSSSEIGVGLQFYRDDQQTCLILVGELKR